VVSFKHEITGDYVNRYKIAQMHPNIVHLDVNMHRFGTVDTPSLLASAYSNLRNASTLDKPNILHRLNCRPQCDSNVPLASARLLNASEMSS
jgi:hypothetical protein